jgi:predicted Fe-Mo cluster-binding NifX family protein
LIASGDTEEIQVKIAVVTEDGVNVSQHFGRAPWYAVFTVDKGQIISREKRAKIGHHEFAGQESHSEGAGPHGYDAESEQRHLGMMSAIPDCQVVIAGGMGMAAYDSIRDRGIEAVITDVRNAEEAAKLQSLGRLPNLKERLH